MTVTSTTNRISYSGNGSTATYSFPFRIFNQSHLLLTLRNDSTLAETTLTISTDYTVTGVGLVDGGSIVLVDGGQDWIDGSSFLDSGWTLVIRRVLPIKQEADLRNQGEFFAASHEDALDKGIMIAQQLDNDIDGSIRLAETDDPASIDTQLPPLVASQYVRVNADGDGFEFAALSAGSGISTGTASGVAIWDGNGTLSVRTFAATGGLEVSNGNGLAGAPTYAISASGVTSAKINASAVTSAKIAADAVTTSKILDLNVTTEKIEASGVTTAKINALAVTTEKLGASAVTAAKIAADAITTAKILDGNVTAAKLESGLTFPAEAHAVESSEQIADAGEETLFSKTLAANALGASGCAMFRAILVTDGDATPNNQTVIYRLKLGSTTIATITLDADTTGAHDVYLEGMIANLGATNSQRGMLRGQVGDPTGSGDPTDLDGGTAAEDTTGNLTVSLTGEWTGSADQCRLKYATLYIVKA